jgi:hypothetical protein
VAANSFRAFGVLTLFLDLAIFCAALDALSTIYLNRQRTMRMLVAFLVVTIVGIGLLFLRRWAAIYFSFPLFVLGISVALGSISQVCFPFNLLWMCEGISLMLPLIVTIRLWPQLSSGGKWYF